MTEKNSSIQLHINQLTVEFNEQNELEFSNYKHSLTETKKKNNKILIDPKKFISPSITPKKLDTCFFFTKSKYQLFAKKEDITRNRFTTTIYSTKKQYTEEEMISLTKEKIKEIIVKPNIIEKENEKIIDLEILIITNETEKNYNVYHNLDSITRYSKEIIRKKATTNKQYEDSNTFYWNGRSGPYLLINYDNETIKHAQKLFIAYYKDKQSKEIEYLEKQLKKLKAQNIK